jgi:TorA maturation chaperone TorD
MTEAATEQVSRLLKLAHAYGCCGRMFGPDGPAAFGAHAAAVAAALESLCETGRDMTLSGNAPAEEAGAEFSRLFDRATVPPYETSQSGSAGQTQVLADIAGFYRAFGFEVRGERPDHAAPELEFAALLCAKEAYARLCGEDEGAETCAQARARFLDEHLLGWLPAFAGRLEGEGSSVFAAVCRAAMALGRADRRQSAIAGR